METNLHAYVHAKAEVPPESPLRESQPSVVGQHFASQKRSDSPKYGINRYVFSGTSKFKDQAIVDLHWPSISVLDAESILVWQATKRSRVVIDAHNLVGKIQCHIVWNFL